MGKLCCNHPNEHLGTEDKKTDEKNDDSIQKGKIHPIPMHGEKHHGCSKGKKNIHWIAFAVE
jgi:hypothetical protein